MNKLNCNDVIKSLECCIKTQCENCCNLGSWHEQWNCMTDLMKKALNLINEMKKQIRVLEDDVENFKSIAEYQQNCNMSRYFILKEKDKIIEEKCDEIVKLNNEIDAMIMAHTNLVEMWKRG